MIGRRAFTLLEMIVSIAVAGIIAVLVYGSAAAGFDTRDALARHRTTAESELRARVLIADAMRHASDESDVNVPTTVRDPARPFVSDAFALVDGMDPRGLPMDRLRFLSRGVAPPLGASRLWIVALEPTAGGLMVRAVPVDAVTEREMTARLDHVRGLDVEVMSLSGREWMNTWATPTQLPAAVRLTFYDATGALVGSPMVVRLGLEAVR